MATKWTRFSIRVGILLFALVFLGCATYQSKVHDARIALSRRDFSKALKDLRPLAEKQNGDQLVYLLDYGVALQLSENLRESNKIFLKADRLAEQLDYISISRVGGSLALNEEMTQYKGDTFEKIFINAYLAMNFLSEGSLDEALVEARRINEKYLKYRADEKKAYELNFFSKYLSAMIWEASGNYDDAYIAYSDSYKIDPEIGILKEDLIRSAKLARRTEVYNQWKHKFGASLEKTEWYDRNKGEIIIIFQQGWGPRKAPSYDEYRLPMLLPVNSKTRTARLYINNETYETRLVYDVQAAAIQTLREDQGILLGKRLAGIATKAVLADQVRQQNQTLGDLTWLVLNLTDRADVRQWSTLPQTIQTVRVYLPPGTYQLSLEGLQAFGQPAGEVQTFNDVQVKAGQKKFLVWRSLN
jgi:hypothetical protein